MHCSYNALLPQLSNSIRSFLIYAVEQLRGALRNHGGGYVNHELFW